MNQTPRALNRVLLALVGLLLAAAGLHGLLIAVAPGYAAGWHALAGRLGDAWGGALRATTLPGQKESWLWIPIAVGLVALLLLLVWWMAVQGKGRTGVFARGYQTEGTRGIVEVGAAVPEQAVRMALSGRTDIVSVGVSTWEPAARAGGDAGLRIKVHPRPGAAPERIAADVEAVVLGLDRTLGRSGPVVVHLAGGARTRMSRSERVD